MPFDSSDKHFVHFHSRVKGTVELSKNPESGQTEISVWPLSGYFDNSDNLFFTKLVVYILTSPIALWG